MSYTIAIDQSTSATKALLFDEECRLVGRSSVEHRQYYPQTGWVEHDAEEIYQNMIEAIRRVITENSELRTERCDYSTENSELRTERWDNSQGEQGNHTSQFSPLTSQFSSLSSQFEFSLALTNQRETVVVWNRHTGRPISRAVVWQDTRGAELCRELRALGYSRMVMEKSGLLIDPNFSASAVKWLLDHIEGARQAAQQGDLLMGTIDTWLVWRLTGGRVHATDPTNASRTMLYNIHTLQWDDDLLKLFDIPRTMLPEVRPCDARFGETTCEGLFAEPIPIAGVLGDSHGALVGQMCFERGSGKVTYGTGSSVMVNIGEQPLQAPEGLVTSVGFAARGRTYYAFEGNIYSTGATLKWICDQLQLVGHPSQMEALATSVADNGGVYIVPAFSGLGAPWWQSDVKGAVFGLTFATTKAHFVRAALESIAYQVKDLVDVMAGSIEHTSLTEICADGGPTKNAFLMQLQADLLATPIVCTEVDDASALGAAVMNGLALGRWQSFDEVKLLRRVSQVIEPRPADGIDRLYAGWREAVGQLIRR